MDTDRTHPQGPDDQARIPMVVEQAAQINPWDIRTWKRSDHGGDSPLIQIPMEITIYNACTDRCDCLNFACACGGWHSVEDFQVRLEILRQKYFGKWVESLPDMRNMRNFNNNVVLDDYSLIAFCIPKCANTSIKAALLHGLGEQFVVTATPSTAPTDVQRHRRFRFASARELADVKYEDWYSFTIVRNPWDRMVSCWSQKVKRRGLYHNFHGFDQFGVTDDTSFEKFIHIIAGVPDAEANIHFQSQTHLISWEGCILPEHIARLENLEEDWKQIQDTSPLPLPDLDHHTTSEHPPYREMYTAETYGLLRRRYSEDIQKLHYDF